MKIRSNIDPNLKETTHSYFKLMGYFGKSSKQINDEVVGILEYREGLGFLETMPPIYKQCDDKRFQIESDKDGVLYGYLEDNTYIRLNKFRTSGYKRNLPGLATIHYIITDLDLSKKSFDELNMNKINHAIVEFDALSQYAAFITPNPEELSKNNEKVPFQVGDTENVTLYLSYEWQKKGNRISYNYECKVELEIWPKNENVEIKQICNKIKNFLSILDDSPINIISIRFIDKDKNSLFTNLHYSNFTEQNSSKRFENALYSNLNFDNYKQNLPNIVKNVINSDVQFNRLVQNYIYNINAQLTPDSALINYVNSVDIYMHGAKYSNGKVIQDLTSKIKFWLKKLPDELYGIFFDKDKKNAQDIFRSNFIQSLVDTRDYLTHYDKRNSPYLLKNQAKEIKYARVFRTIIHVFLLFSYGVPAKFIKNDYEGINFQDYLNVD